MSALLRLYQLYHGFKRVGWLAALVLLMGVFLLPQKAWLQMTVNNNDNINTTYNSNINNNENSDYNFSTGTSTTNSNSNTNTSTNSNTNNSNSSEGTTTNTASCLQGPTLDMPVCIINMAQEGTTYYEDSIIKMESQPTVSEVRVFFYNLDSPTTQMIKTDAAVADEVDNFWRYNLLIADFNEGNYRIQTKALVNGNEIITDQRDFIISSVSEDHIEITLQQPEADDQLQGEYHFSAVVNKEVEEVNFYLTNTSVVLVSQLPGVLVDTANNIYQAFYNTAQLPDGQYYVQAEAVQGTKTSQTDKTPFYINNNEPTRPAVFFISPNDDSLVSGRILIQAETTESATAVDFRIIGHDLLPADQFEANRWQIYLNTKQYVNGPYQIIARADLPSGIKESEILDITINNAPVAEDDYNTDNNGKDRVDDSGLSPFGQSEDDEVTKSSTMTGEQENSDNETTSQVDENYKNSDDNQDQSDDCLRYNLSELTCEQYLRQQDEISSECAAQVVDVAACKEKYSSCLQEGNSLDFCQKYLSDPRLERWCGREDFYSQPKCESYRQQQPPARALPSEAAQEVGQVCLDQQVSDPEKCQKLLSWLSLPKECREAKNEGRLYKLEDCQQYLKERYLDPYCRQLNLTDLSECRQYLAKASTGDAAKNSIDCSQDDCSQLIENKYAAEMAVHKSKKAVVEQILHNRSSQIITQAAIGTNDQEYTDLIKELPIKLSADGQVSLLAAKEAIKIDNESFQSALPAIVVHDSDGDGLPDEVEKRLGTDPNNVDSDGDSYLDGQEVRNGYDPLRPLKKMERRLAPIEVALVGGQTIEQPLAAGQEVEDLKIMSVTEKEIINGEESQTSMTLAGSGDPFEVHTLYIYSDLPLVITVQADSSGRWEYDLADSLVDGEHQVFVTINDDTGKILKKSRGFTFFVQEAKAVTADQYLASTLLNNSSSLEKYYIYGSLGLIGLALLVLLFLYWEVKKKSGVKA